mgnify:FL=1
MEKKKPEIRFNGFEGEWATTTLGECFLERVERSAEGELISVTISQGVVRASDLDRIDNSSNDKSNYKVVEVGDIAYNSMRMWQGACGYSLYKGICSPAYTVVIPQNNIDVVYCFYLFKRNETLQLFRVNSQGLTSDTWNLKYPAFSQIKCSFPSLSEQEKIGLFLTTLDKLIAKLEAKLDKLRKLKQALLEKMFTNVNRGGYETPEIRFKGYTDKWLTTTLGACSKKIITKNNGNEYNIVLTNSAECGIVDQRSYFDREIVNTENIQGYYIVSQDDFVYNPRISMQAPVGPINRSKFEYTGVMSPLYYVFRITDKRFSLTYMEWFFKSSSWYDFMYKNGNSGARSDRFAINDDAFLRLPIYHPKDISEQEQIGKCFTQIDTHFNKTSTKLTKLRNIKQSLLQKMFV